MYEKQYGIPCGPDVVEGARQSIGKPTNNKRISSLLKLKTYASKMEMTRRLTIERNSMSLMGMTAQTKLLHKMKKTQSHMATDSSPEKKQMVDFLRSERRKLRKKDQELEIRRRPSRPAKQTSVDSPSVVCQTPAKITNQSSILS